MTARIFLRRVLLSATRHSGVNRTSRYVFSRRGLLVLCYHGVVKDDHPDQPFVYRNTVSVRQFRSQLEFLKRHFCPISARELISHVRGGSPLRPRSVLVTFDDGYWNNLANAAPILLEQKIPALFSITTGHIGAKDILWPDEVNLRILYWPHSRMPFPSADAFPSVEIPSDQESRKEIAHQVRDACKRQSEDRVRTYINALRETPCPALERRDHELYSFLSWDDVRSLSAAGFDIGSHTVCHPILTQISPKRLEYELTESKTRIEAETGKPCECLAYPNGQRSDFNQTVQDAAERAGYLLAFTATGSYASLQGQRYALSRIGVPGQQRDEVFESRASGLHI